MSISDSEKPAVTLTSMLFLQPGSSSHLLPLQRAKRQLRLQDSIIQDSFQDGSVRIHAREKKISVSRLPRELNTNSSQVPGKKAEQCQTDVPASSNMLVRTINSPSDCTMCVPADWHVSDIRHEVPAHTCRFLILFHAACLGCSGRIAVSRLTASAVIDSFS